MPRSRCGDPDRDGKYRDSDGAVTLDLKGGKASLNYGKLHFDGTYTVDGDKTRLRAICVLARGR
jgi:hypothetical protein